MLYQNSPKEYFFFYLLYIVHQSELTELKPHLYKTSFQQFSDLKRVFLVILWPVVK